MGLQNTSSELISKVRPAQGATLAGNGFFFGIGVESNHAYGFRADAAAALPTASNDTVVQAKVVPRSMFGVVQITGLARALADGQPGSFANATQFSMDQILDHMTHYQEGAIFRANSDPLALVNESPSGTEITVDTPGPLWIKEGMAIAFLASNGTLSTTSTVASVDWANNSITTATDISGSISDNDLIFLRGEQAEDNSAIAARGFDGLAASTSASGTYLNVSRSTHARWAGNTIAASSASLDEDLLYRAVNRALQESGNKTNGWSIIAHPNQLRKLAEVVYPRQQFSGTSVSLGAQVTSFAGLSVMAVTTCPETKVYAGDMSVLNRFATKNGELQVSTDFGPAFKFVAGYDSGYAYLRSYSNICVRNPRKWVAITGLADVTSR